MDGLKTRSAHRRLSASGLDMAKKCPASHALPAVDTESGDAATAGTARHRFLDEFAAAWGADPDRSVAAARAKALDAATERNPGAPWLPTLHALDLEAQVRTRNGIASRIDVAQGYALDPATREVRALGPVDQRAYALDEPWICGTYDWLMHDGSGIPTLVDFKGSHRVAPAESNRQLAFYAACAAKAHGWPAVRVELRYIEDDGTVTIDAAVLDEWELEVALNRVVGVWLNVQHARGCVEAGTSPPMSVHAGCQWCSSLRVCPAQITALRALIEREDRAADDLVALDDEDAGRVWVLLGGAKALVDRLTVALRARASRGGLPLPDGGRLVPVESRKLALNVDKALPVLRAVVGDRAESLVRHERAIDPTAVDALAIELAHASGRTIKEQKERVWNDLGAAGAVTESTYVQLRVRK